jgi:alanine dehydrogenase
VRVVRIFNRASHRTARRDKTGIGGSYCHEERKLTLLITKDEVERVFSIEQTIPVIEEAFRMAGEGTTDNPPRFCMPLEDGFMRFGPAALQEKGFVGFKLWANFGSGPARGWNFLFSRETGELLAILHSYSLGRMRTSATTAVAAKYLSRRDAGSIGIYGTGRLAEAQIRAIRAVRPISFVKAYSRTEASRNAFCEEASSRLNLKVIPCASPEEAASDVDIVVSITSSQTPVVFEKWITRACLVLAIGANQWYEREIDAQIVRVAKMVVVDDKEQAKREGGDLLWPIAHGLITWDRIEELKDVVTGRAKLPDLNSGVIVFESHGLAIEDVAVSAEVYKLALARGLGRDVDLNLGAARSEIGSPGVNSPVRR